MQLEPVFHCSSLSTLDPGSGHGREIPAICMVPVFGMVILPQNHSTGNGQVPGCCCIRSLGTMVFSALPFIFSYVMVTKGELLKANLLPGKNIKSEFITS